MQTSEEAQSIGIYVCGMLPCDTDDLMYGVIVTRDGLQCHHLVEFEYYNNPRTVTAITATLCAYCANSSGAKGFVDEHLSLEWKSVLLVCLECRAAGALPVARTKRSNGASNEHRSQRARVAASSSPQASNEDVLAPVVVGGAVV